MRPGALTVDVDLRIESKYKEALSGEQKAELAERMLELLSLPNAPKLEIASGETVGPMELVSHALSMEERRMSYSVKPKGWVFEDLAIKEIEHCGGVVAFMRRRSGALGGLALGAAAALSAFSEDKLKSMLEKAAKERGMELARAYMNGLAEFFKKNFRPYEPHDNRGAAAKKLEAIESEDPSAAAAQSGDDQIKRPRM